MRLKAARRNLDVYHSDSSNMSVYAQTLRGPRKVISRAIQSGRAKHQKALVLVIHLMGDAHPSEFSGAEQQSRAKL
jgi:hypothetical protein